MLKQFVWGVAGLLGLLQLAHAGMITDVVEQHEYVGWWETHSYTHDLTDNDAANLFVPGSDVAVGGTLEVQVLDNQGDWGGFFDWEVSLFIVEAFDFDTGGISFGTDGSTFGTDLEVNALAAINGDGQLDVTVWSLWGDFIVGNSVLNLEILDSVSPANIEPVDVPEPGVMILLAIGLIGLKLARPRSS